MSPLADQCVLGQAEISRILCCADSEDVVAGYVDVFPRLATATSLNRIRLVAEIRIGQVDLNISVLNLCFYTNKSNKYI